MSFSSTCDRVLETLKRRCLPPAEPLAGERLVGEALRTLEQAGLARCKRVDVGADLWEATNGRRAHA